MMRPTRRTTVAGLAGLGTLFAVLASLSSVTLLTEWIGAVALVIGLPYAVVRTIDPPRSSRSGS